jgi:hypothetical protein
VRFSLDLPDLSNNTCTLIEQGNDLLIGVVYLFSAGLQSSCGVWDLLAVASNRTAKQNHGTKWHQKRHRNSGQMRVNAHRSFHPPQALPDKLFHLAFTFGTTLGLSNDDRFEKG